MTDETTRPLIDGVQLKLGAETYTVPALNFKALRRLSGRIETLSSITGTMSEEQMDTAIDIILTAIQRNYPNMTKDTLEEILDLGNMRPTLFAILGQSGLVTGEGKAAPKNQ